MGDKRRCALRNPDSRTHALRIMSICKSGARCLAPEYVRTGNSDASSAIVQSSDLIPTISATAPVTPVTVQHQPNTIGLTINATLTQVRP